MAKTTRRITLLRLLAMAGLVHQLLRVLPAAIDPSRYVEKWMDGVDAPAAPSQASSQERSARGAAAASDPAADVAEERYKPPSHPRVIGIQRSDSHTYTVAVPPMHSSSAPFAMGSVPRLHRRRTMIMARDRDVREHSKCKPMYDWQSSSFPDCNSFHELDMMQMRVINTGGFRIAFEMNDNYREGRGETRLVYKTMKWGDEDRKVNHVALELQRRDGLVLERTTKSRFIPNIYGYCGLAVVMDYMPEGNMHDYIKGARLAGGSTLDPVDKLRIAVHIASGVADLHTIDGTKVPSYFHNDLFPHQFLFQDGLFKLNDFHVPKPIYVRVNNTDEPCTRQGFQVKLRKRRSLEQHQHFLRHPDFKPVVPDKTDVWMMGNVIYTVLTDLYLFEKPRNLNCSETSEELVNGRRSPLPDRIKESNEASHLAMKQALDMCWTHDSVQRPSAAVVAEYLLHQLKEIVGEDDPDLRIELPERDKDQSLTSSDYNLYNYDD